MGEVCRCGHVHTSHAKIQSHNYSAGKCKRCSCKHFIIRNEKRKELPMFEGSQELAACDSAKEVGRPTITSRLLGEKGTLEKRLANVNKGLELLKENPKMQELLDVLGRTYL